MTSLLAELPRVLLMPAAATPLTPAPRLSRELGVQVWLKRDDLTGFGLGGNKVRGLEYLLADAETQGCDTLVTGAGPQSNWAMLASLAARTQGLEPHIVYYGTRSPAVGNHLLNRLVGARIRFTGDTDRSSVDTAIAELADDLRARGRRPYVLPRGGATALGSVGYVRAAAELATQLRNAGVQPRAVWLATGSCGTQAGLVAGAGQAELDATIVGVTVSRPAAECRERIHQLATDTMALLDLPGAPAPIEIIDGYADPGYGRPSPAGHAATVLLAQTEGVFLDPVFGAKAMAALCDLAHRGPVDGGPVVFLVTGGAPTLFAETLDPATAPTPEYV